MNYLITGAGSGIGRATAIALAQQNHNCFLLGRNEEKLSETLSLLNTGNHSVLIADITSLSSLQSCVEQNPNLVLDGIIANAGLGGENYFDKDDRWDAIINTNLNGTYFTVNTFLPALQKSNAPVKHVLITSSVLARLGVANYAAYCASKAGLLGLMRSWAIQYAPENILVNAVCPGWVNTDMAQEGLQGIADGLGITKDEFYTIAMQSVPLRRMSKPEEIAALFVYLLQQESITGQTLDINCGSVMNS